MIVIREYHNEIEAMIARSVLDAHGIPAMVMSDNAGGAYPSMNLLFPVRLAVKETDAAEAIRVLDTPYEGHEASDDDDFNDQTWRP